MSSTVAYGVRVSNYLMKRDKLDALHNRQFVRMLPEVRGYWASLVEDLEVRRSARDGVPQRYLWSSPVYWAEKGAQLAGGIWAFATRHRAVTAISTLVGLISIVVGIHNLT